MFVGDIRLNYCCNIKKSLTNSKLHYPGLHTYIKGILFLITFNREVVSNETC